MHTILSAMNNTAANTKRSWHINFSGTDFEGGLAVSTLCSNLKSLEHLLSCNLVWRDKVITRWTLPCSHCV